MPVNTGLATVGVAIQDDPRTPKDKPDFVHGLTAGNPLAMERTVDTIAVACGTRSNSDAFVNEINMNPSITTLGYQEVAPIYFYGALGHIETEPLGGGLYKHTATVDESIPDLTVFGAMGQQGSLGYGRTCGCKVNELVASFSDSEPLTLAPSLMGIDLERLFENPNAGVDPLCYSGFYSPVGGEFKIDTATQTPQANTVTAASVTITNDCEAVRDPTTRKPSAIGAKKNKVAVSYSVVPDDYLLWWRMVTGSSIATGPSAKIVYGSYSMKYVHVDNPDFTLTIHGSKVPFACDPPEAEPEGGNAVFEFTSEDSYVEKVGASPIVVEIVNDIEDYFDPRTYQLPKVIPRPVAYGEVLPGVEAEDAGTFYVSARSKFIRGTARRVSGVEGVEDGYYMPIALDDWEGATATPVAASRVAESPVEFKDGFAVVHIGDESIEAVGVTVTSKAGSTTYELAVGCAEDLPSVEGKVLTDGSHLGVDYSEAGDFDISNRSLTITGKANLTTAVKWSGDKNLVGYFVPLHFDNGKRIRTSREPSGRALDGSGDVLVCLGTDAPDLKWVEVDDADGNATRYEVRVRASGNLVNTMGVTKWGYAATKEELKEALGDGKGEACDHDTDVFYLVTKDKAGGDYAQYVPIVTVGGKEYATFPKGQYTYHYIGLGPDAEAGHQTDADYVSSDGGRTWEKATEAVSVACKEATLQVRKFDEALTAENGQDLLPKGGVLVFGVQGITCDGTKSFSDPAKAAYVSASPARAVAKAKTGSRSKKSDAA